jgi:predicted nucleotidyltransferase component of viral defense system
MEPDKKILTNRQIILLKSIAGEPYVRERFYLTGGTALAGFYLHHRLSEDLDFFSEEEVDLSALTVFIETLKRHLSLKRIDFEQSYNRNLFFLDFGDEIVKIEFTYFPFPRIEQGKDTFGVSLDSEIDIAVNKLFTIYQQSRARDYIDLYCLLQLHAWSMETLIKKARAKFDWHIDVLQLGTQFMNAEDVKDLPRMLIELKEESWRQFFVAEAKRLQSQVLE